jgi:hypothetical protein
MTTEQPSNIRPGMTIMSMEIPEINRFRYPQTETSSATVTSLPEALGAQGLPACNRSHVWHCTTVSMLLLDGLPNFLGGDTHCPAMAKRSLC